VSNLQVAIHRIKPEMSSQPSRQRRLFFAACQDCNLKLKAKVCHHGYVVVCLFHNLASYDSAFILKNVNKKYVERVNANGTTSFDDVKAILIN